jgi:hypothetical protein
MEELTLIEQECKFIKDFDEFQSHGQLKKCLDTIVIELNKMKILPNAKIIQEIVLNISFSFNHDRIFSNVKGQVAVRPFFCPRYFLKSNTFGISMKF